MDERSGLDAYPAIHLVGAGGSGMAPLAKLLAGLGHRVTGSDLMPGRRLMMLNDLGIEAWVGHRPDGALAADLVAASSAVPATDPELEAARAAGIPVWGRPELLDAITASMPTVGFAGTHGKTTSTALAVAALRGCGRDPSFVVGSELIDLNTGAHLGRDEPLLLEADEAFGTFRHLRMAGLLVTNVEADHLDYYGNLAALEEAFALVANRTRGPVLACLDDPGARRLAERSPVIGYGHHPEADWRLGDVVVEAEGVNFLLTGPVGEARVEVPRPGFHVASNAAGVLALLAEMGHPLEDLASALKGFAGVRRRFEVRARVAGVTVVDDYAHHPTEVAATISAGRGGGWGRIVAVFQPHRYSRTAELAPFFGEPLASADQIIVTDVYPAGETPEPGVTGDLVAEAVAAAGGSVRYVPHLADVVDAVADELLPGDLVLLLGAGDVNSLSDELAEALEDRE